MSRKTDVLAFACLSAVLTLPAAAAPLHKTAQTPFTLWTAPQLADMAKTPQKSTQLDDHESFWLETLSRDKSGEVELHDHWDDNIVIQAGEASFTYGGKMTGGHEIEPGNWRAATIEGGKTVTVHAGDVFHVPAGIPHKFTLASGKTVRYLVFKVRE